MCILFHFVLCNLMYFYYLYDSHTVSTKAYKCLCKYLEFRSIIQSSVEGMSLTFRVCLRCRNILEYVQLQNK